MDRKSVGNHGKREKEKRGGRLVQQRAVSVD